MKEENKKTWVQGECCSMRLIIVATVRRNSNKDRTNGAVIFLILLVRSLSKRYPRRELEFFFILSKLLS